MDRFWLLTWTTYGTWLPGSRRGFVGSVRDPSGQRRTHNTPGASYDANLPRLQRYAQSKPKGPPVYLNREQARTLLTQFEQTAQHRGWRLLATAIMPNHVHLVVGVAADPSPSEILKAFKSYASRTLNTHWSRPPSGTWWTESGSKRKLPHESAVLSAVRYVEQQQNALLIWISEIVKN